MTEGDQTAFGKRVKRARRRFLLALGLVPAVAVLANVVVLIVDPVGPAALPFVVVGGALALFWADRQSLRPDRWSAAVTVAAVVGGVLLIVPPLGLAHVISGPVSRVVVLGGWAIAAALGVVAARSLAGQAKRALLEPFDDALVDSAVEVPFRNGQHKLVVAPHEIVVTALSSWLATGTAEGPEDHQRRLLGNVLRGATAVADAFQPTDSGATTQPSESTQAITASGPVRRPLDQVRSVAVVDATTVVRMTFDDGQSWDFATGEADRLVRLVRGRAFARNG